MVNRTIIVVIVHQIIVPFSRANIIASSSGWITAGFLGQSAASQHASGSLCGFSHKSRSQPQWRTLQPTWFFSHLHLVHLDFLQPHSKSTAFLKSYTRSTESYMRLPIQTQGIPYCGSHRALFMSPWIGSPHIWHVFALAIVVCLFSASSSPPCRALSPRRLNRCKDISVLLCLPMSSRSRWQDAS
jgi:hypothetical protein